MFTLLEQSEHNAQLWQKINFANSAKGHICDIKSTRVWFIYISKRQSDFAILRGMHS